MSVLINLAVACSERYIVVEQEGVVAHHSSRQRTPIVAHARERDSRTAMPPASQTAELAMK